MLVVTEIVNCMFNDKKDKLNERLFIVLKRFCTFICSLIHLDAFSLYDSHFHVLVMFVFVLQRLNIVKLNHVLMVELAKKQPQGTAAFVKVDFGEKTVTVSENRAK